MSYDHETADRIRECLAGEPGLSEKSMFGGRAFLLDGHMAVAASSKGGLLLRCAEQDTEALAGGEHVGRFVMNGKEMTGWLRVDAPAYESDDALAEWVARGVAVARSLPPKD